MTDKIDRLVTVGLLTWGCWIAMVLIAQARPVPSPPCIGHTARYYNATDQAGTIVIGHVPGRNYVVVIPGRHADLLNAVRQCIPDAFLTRSRLGFYIRAGAFSSRSAAESVVWLLRSHGFTDARVVYFH